MQQCPLISASTPGFEVDAVKKLIIWIQMLQNNNSARHNKSEIKKVYALLRLHAIFCAMTHKHTCRSQISCMQAVMGYKQLLPIDDANHRVLLCRVKLSWLEADVK